MAKKYQKEEVVKGVLDFLKDSTHESALSEVASELTNIADIVGLSKTAFIYTIVPFTEIDKKDIKNKLEKLVGHEIILREVIKPDILGGFKIKLGDWVYDSSIKGELETLKNELYANI